jgi:hypothetical protein
MEAAVTVRRFAKTYVTPEFVGVDLGCPVPMDRLSLQANRGGHVHMH